MREETGFDEVEPALPGADWAQNSPWGVGFVAERRLRLAYVLDTIEWYEESEDEQDRRRIGLIKGLDLTVDDLHLLLTGLAPRYRAGAVDQLPPAAKADDDGATAHRPRGRPPKTKAKWLKSVQDYEEKEAQLSQSLKREPYVHEVVEALADDRGTGTEAVKRQLMRARARLKEGDNK